MPVTRGQDRAVVIETGTTVDTLTVSAALRAGSYPLSVSRWRGLMRNTGATNTMTYVIRGFVAEGGILFETIASGILAPAASVPITITNIYEIIQILLRSTTSGASTTFRIEASGAT